MLKNQHISIVVPIKNEAENIQKLTREINKACNKIKFEILFVNDGSDDIHIVKDAPIPAGSSLQVLDGGAKIVMVSGDALKVKSNTASSADVWVSVVDTISE